MRVGIDIGGTFTDLVSIDDGVVRVVKVASTPDPADGFAVALGRLGAAPGEIRHGTTVATNAVIERRGARLGFVATEGFRHLLHLGRQDRPSLYDLRVSRPAPLVRREDCVGVAERVGPDGAVQRRIDEDGVRDALRSLSGSVDAIAVTLLHAYANPAHERRVAEIAAEVLPSVSVSVSTDVLPEFREYERASTTALNAYVEPVLSGYLGRIRDATGGAALGVMWSGGGIRGAADSIRRPVHTLLSGPAAGVLGAAWSGSAAGFDDIVTLDMGGTSADVAIVNGGIPGVAEESSLDGLPFRTPCIDLVSVGAGGGSIAWLDEGGALRVGPRSAGATPGPASYGRGGAEPAVTDAHVVRGHLGPEGLAGGELALDAAAAREAVERLGRAAGLDLDETARGILRVVRATMTRAIRSVSIERGRDVRGYALVAFGGAGPLHGTALASELGIRTVVVPPAPGALAALGLLVAPRRADVSVSRPMEAAPANDGALRDTLGSLVAGALDELGREGIAAGDCDVTCAVECRYAGQSHELRVPAQPGDGFARVAGAFHVAHRARYGFAREGMRVEAVTFRAAAQAQPAPLDLRPSAVSGDPAPRTARVVDGERVAVYDRALLPRGWRLEGPALVSELDSTTWIDAGWEAEVHQSGSMVLRPCR